MHTYSLDTILRLKEVMKITGLGRSSIYQYIREGKFPKQRKLGPRSVGWLSGEVFAWVAQRTLAA